MPPANYDDSFDESYTEATSSDLESGGSTSGPSEILGMLRRRLVLVAFTTAAAASAAYLYAQSRPPSYEGSFQIQVEPATTDPGDPIIVSGQKSPEVFKRVDYPTQIAVLRSPRIIEPVLEALQITEGVDVSVRQFVDRLAIKQIRGARIIEASYRSDNLQEVVAATNILSEAFLNYSLQDRKGRLEVGIDFIQERRTELEAQIESLSRELEGIQREYTLLDIDSESAALTAQLQQVSGDLAAVRQELLEQRQFQQLLEGQVGLAAERVLAALTLSEDPAFQQSLSEISGIDNSIALERARFKAGSPIIAELEARRRQLLQLLQERGRELLGAPVSSQELISLAIPDQTRRGLAQQLVSVSTQIELLAERERTLVTSRARLQAQIAEFPQVVRRYTNINNELNSARGLQANLLDQEQRLEVQNKQSEVPWELLVEPIIRDRSPSARRFLILGVGGGFLVGAALAFLFERAQDCFYEEGDVGHSTEVLAAIPDCDVDRSPISYLLLEEAALNHAQRSDENLAAFLETFNSLYARLRFDNADRLPLRSLGVASANAGDGKTTVAAFLAYVIASTGRSVLLVDADLREPSLHKLLGLDNDRGLIQLLESPSQGLKQKSALQAVPASKNLRVLTAGGTTVNAAQLLASENMINLAQKLRDKYDFVIYDTPELDKFADAQYIADRTNGLLMVARLRKTKRSAFKAVLGTLESVRLNVVGTVANAARSERAKEEDELNEVPALNSTASRVEETSPSNTAYSEGDLSPAGAVGLEDSFEDSRDLGRGDRLD